MFLKQKRTGEIKGQGCADGRKQRWYTDKDTTSSPTVATKSVFLTSIIDALEHRDVATVDIPGAFMQSGQDETVHVHLTGVLVTLLTQCDPKYYAAFIVHEGNEPVSTLNSSKRCMTPYARHCSSGGVSAVNSYSGSSV